MVAELNQTVAAWLADAAPPSWLQVVVVPPCDRLDLVGSWARGRGHRVLGPPPGPMFDAFEVPAPEGLEGDGLLVVPRLERWFLRHRNGLAPVRALLARLCGLERHCLVGCDSWAWAFLVKAVGARMMLPEPLTFTPFDGACLRRWFGELVADRTDASPTFRLAHTGDDVMACDDEGRPHHGHLDQLAARSLGIPWVAWHSWRASLRVSTHCDEQVSERARAAMAGDARTFWVVEPNDFVVPRHHEDRALLVLQALLLHGGLTGERLADVLPATGEPDVVHALRSAGFVERDEGLLRIRAAAYPTVRRALQTDGYPLGAM